MVLTSSRVDGKKGCLRECSSVVLKTLSVSHLPMIVYISRQKL